MDRRRWAMWEDGKSCYFVKTVGTFHKSVCTFCSGIKQFTFQQTEFFLGCHSRVWKCFCCSFLVCFDLLTTWALHYPISCSGYKYKLMLCCFDVSSCSQIVRWVLNTYLFILVFVHKAVPETFISGQDVQDWFWYLTFNYIFL